MKKIFTLKRVALLMSLIFIYSFAFMFVKVYAERSILTASFPDDSALVGQVGKNAASNEPASSEAPDNEEQEPPQTYGEPVEKIVNKQNAAGYAMLGGAAATTVSDGIEISEPPKTEATTVPTSAEPTAVSTEKTEKTEKTKATEATSAPEPEKTKQTKDSDGDADPEELDEDESPEDVDEPQTQESPEYVDEGEADLGGSNAGGSGEYRQLTDEEIRKLLEDLGMTPGQNDPSLTNPNDVLVSGKSYRDDIVMIYDKRLGDFRTDNAFDLVCEITYYEIGSSKDPEAIKAQAIAAYSYIKHYQQEGRYAKIGTKSGVPQIIIDCVNEIDGLAMFYGDEYIMASFSSSTGGYSSSSKNVWGEDVPYLQSVKNDYDHLDTKNYGKVTTYTVDEVRKAIESNTDIKLSDNCNEWIRILSYDDSIYAGQLSIDGHTRAYINGKERDITGYNFRTYILNIRSTVFNVTYSDGVFTFTTYGYGHGVGMSQTGANLYAIYGGYTFDQILHHYYTGVTIR